ncbi:MAG: ribosome biogenesis GTPase Der [Pseudomonadota bacterium]
MAFSVAIIGRPNVGKSTLFNRLVGKRLALVDDTPGVTRDRRFAEGSIGGLSFDVIDTAGLEEGDEESLQGRMWEQTQAAIEEADVCLFLIDARAGILPDDRTFASILRRTEKPVILVANKMEGKPSESGYYDAFSLGFGDPVPVSAEHGQGMADLHDAIVEAVGESRAYPDEEEKEADEASIESRTLKIAVVGRPNAGKSTLINQMVGEDRLLTGPEAGITRDSISVDWEWQGRTLRLFDTAGMRRKAKVQEKLEKLSVSDGLRAIKFAEVVIIVLDVTKPFEKQDLQIADLIIREGRAPVIALNKWDLIDDRQEVLKELLLQAQEHISQVKGLKVVPISGATGENIDKLMETVLAVHKVWNKRVPTAPLNRWLEDVQYHHPPPAVSGRRVKLKYATQVKSRPPTFAIVCSRPEALPDSYTRYLTNSIRREFDLDATPIRIHMRKGDNPYAGRKKRKT